MNQLQPNKQQGFALIEILLALTVMLMLASALAPSIVARAQLRGAQRLTGEIFELHNAARAYYVDNAAWPASIADLTGAGYLPAGWSGVNPFGNDYNLASNGDYFTVATDVPATIAAAIVNNIPLGEVTGTGNLLQVRSSATVPGLAVDLTALRNYIDNRIAYLTEVWVPQNVVVTNEGTVSVGWWSNYNAYKPGYIYGNKMDTNLMKLRVGEPGAGGQPYGLGLTIPVHGSVRTAYQWNPNTPETPIYVYKNW